MLKKFCSIFILSVVSLPFTTATALAAPDRIQQMKEIESQALAVTKELCGDDLGCRYLREDLEKETDQDGRNIQFNALAIYVTNTLAPKLTKSSDTDAKMKELEKLFDDHIRLEHDED